MRKTDIGDNVQVIASCLLGSFGVMRYQQLMTIL